jgi:hypothetical protein
MLGYPIATSHMAIKEVYKHKKIKFYKNCTPNIAAIFKVPSEYEIADDRAIFHWLSHIFFAANRIQSSE